MDWHPHGTPRRSKSELRWTVAGALCLALTLGVMVRRWSAKVPVASPAAEELRDAVASPVTPAAVGGLRGAMAPNPGWFAGPAGRRADAERALAESRRRIAAKRRRPAR